MPLVIKDYSWRQTEQVVLIKVPLKGVHPSKVDLFTTEKYIKAHYAPYFFEVFLLHPTDISKSKCTYGNDEIIFELIKNEVQIWEKLEPDIDKAAKTSLKTQIISDEHERAQNEKKKRSEKRAELKRTAVREQIAIDNKQRELIENVKKQEKEIALGDLEKWQKSEIVVIDDPDPPVRKSKQLVNRSAIKNAGKSAPVPFPRKSGIINVSFTPRDFPTPSRESKVAEEEEWLRKQAEARRTCGFVCEDLRPEERNPQWLKEKGDEFFKVKNYLAAISAYSFGIKMNGKYAALYSNRSAAHFAIGNYHKAIMDCTDALNLMKPEVQANLEQRAKCLARRGAALCKLGLFRQGADEIKAAVHLRPNDQQLIEDLEKARSLIEEHESDSD